LYLDYSFSHSPYGAFAFMQRRIQPALVLHISAKLGASIRRID
jgi:hypothetical protein